MSDETLNAAVDKELLIADRYYDNLCRVGGWRLIAILQQAKLCRGSLDKAAAINGYTGRWLLDLWLYVVNALPWFLPATVFFVGPLAYTLFCTLVAIISRLMSSVTMEERVVEATIEVPYYVFWTTTKTIEKTVLVPVTNLPDPRVSTAIAGALVLLGTVAFSYVTKAVFKLELRFRRRMLVRQIERTRRKRIPA